LSFRELVATSLNSSHLETKPHESAIDRVGAHAWASDLGRALWYWAIAEGERRVRSVFDRREEKRKAGAVLHHLLRKAMNRTGIRKAHKQYQTLERVCLMVMHEWRYPACQTCGGSGELEGKFSISGTSVKAICATCSGSGKQRYADAWRADYLKLDQSEYRKWERHIARVAEILSAEDLDCVRVCRMQLERDT
jgi:hypothetical protein